MARMSSRKSMPSSMPRALAGIALAIASTLIVAGCDSSTTIPPDRLSKLVLTEQDLPSGFASFYSGAQVRLDNQGAVRSDASRYGREGGWITRLHRSDQSVTAGPLVVESRADLFKDIGGATSDLAAYRVLFSRTSGRCGNRQFRPHLWLRLCGQPTIFR